MEELSGIFKQIEEHSFTINECFLCGCELTEENRTEEHVIPKWLQHKFDLWDQKLSLLNETLIPYRFLIVPCCFECNNIHLSPFENKIKEAVDSGYDAFEKLDRESVFLWLGKIYFGIMYRELFLTVDRSDPTLGTITNDHYLKSFYSHLLFLQGIRKKHSFNNFFPASIYLFKTQKPIELNDQWDFIDNHHTMFISIRMGEIGVLALLQDCEATKELEEHIERHKKIELHPLQFKELSAKILYKGILMNRTPKFINAQFDNYVTTTLMSLQGGSTKPIFECIGKECR